MKNIKLTIPTLCRAIFIEWWDSGPMTLKISTTIPLRNQLQSLYIYIHNIIIVFGLLVGFSLLSIFGFLIIGF